MSYMNDKDLWGEGVGVMIAAAISAKAVKSPAARKRRSGPVESHAHPAEGHRETGKHPGRNQPQTIFRTPDKLRSETLRSHEPEEREKSGKPARSLFLRIAGKVSSFLFCKVFPSPPFRMAKAFRITVPVYGAEQPAGEAGCPMYSNTPLCNVPSESGNGRFPPAS